MCALMDRLITGGVSVVRPMLYCCQSLASHSTHDAPLMNACFMFSSSSSLAAASFTSC